jgi:hypothetical protein
MSNKSWGLALLLTIGAAQPAIAQGLETLGNRAAGMSAFVAVADDVSAVAWNPAGLVIGPLFNMSIDLGRSSAVPDGAPQMPEAAGKLGTTLIGIGLTPLGLSYYRIASSVLEAAGSNVANDSNREEGRVAARSLVTAHLGATVLHSVGDYLTVGTTLKLVHGSVAAANLRAASWTEGFDRLEMLDSTSSMRGDLDVGAMFALDRVRAGIVARNLTQPTFAADPADNSDVVLERHARAGVAWGDRWPGLARLIVAVDVDLTRVPDARGERRDIAAGAERWFRGHQIGIRGGVRTSTVGDARPVVSGGMSYAIRSGTYVDAYFARGEAEQSAWGFGARLTY